jgi:hypothetical protein
MGEKRNAYSLLVGKPEGKRPLGRARRRWVDNIRMDIGEVGWGDVDWIGLAKDRNRWRTVVNSVLNLQQFNNSQYVGRRKWLLLPSIGNVIFFLIPDSEVRNS